MRRLFLASLALFFSIARIFAQQSTQEIKHAPTAAGTHNSIACGVSKGCATFNEMVRNNDVSLRNLHDDRLETLVCFDDDKNSDSFFVIRFGKQQTLSWEQGTGTNAMWQVSPDFMLFTDFVKGLSNRQELQPIIWKRNVVDPAGKLGPDDTIHAELNEQSADTSVVIDEASIEYRTAFINASDAKVDYTVRIRRSTKRFERSAKTSAGLFTFDGRCTELSVRMARGAQ
jgi:hypothetical protein